MLTSTFGLLLSKPYKLIRSTMMIMDSMMLILRIRCWRMIMMAFCWCFRLLWERCSMFSMVSFPSPHVWKTYVHFRDMPFSARGFEDCNKIAKPLSVVVAKKEPFYLSKERQVAFTKLKEALPSLVSYITLFGENKLSLCVMHLVMRLR